MRKLLIALLLAGAAATPALADPGDWHSNRESRGGDARESRGERHQSNDSNSNSSQNQSDSGSSPAHFSAGRGGHDDSSAGSNHGGPQGGEHHDPSSSGGSDNNGAMNWRGRGSFSGGQQSGGVQNDSGNHGGWQHRVTESGGSDAGTQHDNRGARDFWTRRTHVVSGGSGDQVGSGGLVQPEHPVPHVFRSRTPVISDTPREGTQPRTRIGDRRTASHVAWNHNWRHDRRYDWWNWRRAHRSHFHLGFYYDPFGWSYRPYEIGWRLWPSYYSSRYWINDPWEYRLPYAPPGYRWIRYYDDAILIDTWDGQIVDVIYNFFW